MNTFGKYFRYHFKESLLRLVIEAAIALILAFSLVYVSENSETGYVYLDLDARSPFFVTFVIAMAELWQFKSRPAFDLFYSLPIKRTSLALAHYLCGALHVAVVVAVNLLMTFFRLASFSDSLKLSLLWVYFAVLYFVCIAFYSIFLFLFDRAENRLDGVVFSAAFICCALPMVWIVGILLDDVELTWGFSVYGKAAGEFVYEIANVFGSLMRSAAVELSLRVLECLFYLLCALLCAFGYFYCFGKRRPEKIGGVSETVFGYATLIPLYGYGLMSIWTESGVIAYLGLPIMAIAYVIHRRSARLRRSDLVSLAVGAVYVTALLIFR